jgi:hypothetical protein
MGRNLLEGGHVARIPIVVDRAKPSIANAAKGQSRRQIAGAIASRQQLSGACSMTDSQPRRPSVESGVFRTFDLRCYVGRLLNLNAKVKSGSSWKTVKQDLIVFGTITRTCKRLPDTRTFKTISDGKLSLKLPCIRCRFARKN